MHFEILIEDQSGKAMLDILLPKIIGKPHTFDVKSYKGVGSIPKKMTSAVDASKRIPDYPQASATLINFNCPKGVDLKELMP